MAKVILHMPEKIPDAYEERAAALRRIQKTYIDESLYDDLALKVSNGVETAIVLTNLIIIPFNPLIGALGATCTMGLIYVLDRIPKGRKAREDAIVFNNRSSDFMDRNWRQLTVGWRLCAHRLTRIAREFEMERGGKFEIEGLSLEACPPDLRKKFILSAIGTGLRMTFPAYAGRQVICLASKFRGSKHSTPGL